MKIKAKQAKIGDTIRTGVITITIENIEKGKQKNGTPIVTFYGPIVRSMGRGNRPSKFYGDVTNKSETFINLK